MSKIQLQDFVEYGRLFEIYGKLLNEDRQKVMTSYFEYNMTLAEIAQERQISRQAVLDAIDKSCQKLKDYDKCLNLLENKNQIRKELEEIKILAKKSNQEEIIKKVDKILGKV